MKIKITDMKCKCDKFFCRKHRHFNDHQCQYDYKNANIKKLETNLVKVVANKVEEI
jgi:hypothetical protein